MYVTLKRENVSNPNLFEKSPQGDTFRGRTESIKLLELPKLETTDQRQKFLKSLKHRRLQK